MKFTKLVDSSHADFLLPVARRWLNTGINVTLNAPDTRITNIKSGIVKATVYASIPTGYDAYTVAFTIPDFMFVILVSGALSVTFIPVFNQRLAKEPE